MIYKQTHEPNKQDIKINYSKLYKKILIKSSPLIKTDFMIMAVVIYCFGIMGL